MLEKIESEIASLEEKKAKYNTQLNIADCIFSAIAFICIISIFITRISLSIIPILVFAFDLIIFIFTYFYFSIKKKKVSKEIDIKKEEKEELLQEEKIKRLSADKYKEIHLKETGDELVDGIIKNIIVKAKLENGFVGIILFDENGKEIDCNYYFNKDKVKNSILQVFED